MKRYLAAASGLVIAIVAAISTATAEGQPPGSVIALPDRMAWKPNPRNPSLEVSDLVGDSTKAGQYVQRVKFPPNSKEPPHTHPEDRTYVIISGTWYIGWGATCDASKMIALPPGSFYTEPANTPHCVESKGEPVVLQISGIGPSGKKLLDAAK